MVRHMARLLGRPGANQQEWKKHCGQCVSRPAAGFQPFFAVRPCPSTVTRHGQSMAPYLRLRTVRVPGVIPEADDHRHFMAKHCDHGRPLFS